MVQKKQIVVIGSGFSGLASACCLAADGYEVQVLEKNEMMGGRARKLVKEGFTFDLGPSWYWMPEVFDNFFAHFGKKTSDYYSLKRLDPSYRVFFDDQNIADIPANFDQLGDLFEKWEPGSKVQLAQFMKEAELKYNVGMGDLIFKPGLSPTELLNFDFLKGALKLDVFTSFHKHVRSFFKDSRIIRIMEFPILFLGETPKKTPALYSLMNHADIKLGTWYPEGGFYSVVEAMLSLGKELGVTFHPNTEVTGFEFSNGVISGVKTKEGKVFSCDAVVAGADYAHVDLELLDPKTRNYDKKYWDSRRYAPSCLLYYIGLSKKVEGVLHHCLFFDSNFDKHAQEIYDDPQWPKSPLFYVSDASKSDPTVAPEGSEALVILIPVAAGLAENEEIKERYYNVVMDRLEKLTKQNLREFVVYKKSYGNTNFVSDYYSYKGNAYGLANTLLQTAFLKPKMRNKKIRNLFYTGQLSVPGPGVPPSIISGQIVSKLVKENIN